MTTMQKILVSVTITAILVVAIYVALAVRTERPTIARVLGDIGIPDADLERLEKLMELEQRRLKQHPAYQKFMQTGPESSEWRGKSGPEAAAAGLAAAERLKAKGLPKLGTEDLVVVNRTHSRIASVSPLMCTQMWIGGDRDSYGEVIRSLAKLTDAEVREWLRVSTNATILALEPPP
jgi:phosphoenolpyruvate carboxylase